MPTLTPDVRQDVAAHDLLRAAHDRAYRFPPGFPGFAAALTFARDDVSVAGRVRVPSPRDVTIDIATDDADETWIRREIGSMAGHRWPSDYAEADGRYALALGPDDRHPLGRLIEFADDPFSSSYRVGAGRIAQVNRQMGGVRFAIVIQEHLTTSDGRVVPTAFTVSFWDAAQGRLTRADTYRDRYEPVDGVFLPTDRRVVTADDTGLVTRELRFHDHELLPGDTGAGAPLANGGANGTAKRG